MVSDIPRHRLRRGTRWRCSPRCPTGACQAIITSPPFALRRKKRYGNPPEHEYVAWFLEFAKEFKRVLRDDGSLVIEIGGAWLKGSPTRSIYQFELLRGARPRGRLPSGGGFLLGQHGEAANAGPVGERRTDRVKDAVTPIWWLSKTERPKADNRQGAQAVQQEYGEAPRQWVQRRAASVWPRDRREVRDQQRRRDPAEPHRDEQHDIEGSRTRTSAVSTVT